MNSSYITNIILVLMSILLISIRFLLKFIIITEGNFINILKVKLVDKCHVLIQIINFTIEGLLIVLFP